MRVIKAVQKCRKKWKKRKVVRQPPGSTEVVPSWVQMRQPFLE